MTSIDHLCRNSTTQQTDIVAVHFDTEDGQAKNVHQILEFDAFANPYAPRLMSGRQTSGINIFRNYWSGYEYTCP